MIGFGIHERISNFATDQQSVYVAERE